MDKLKADIFNALVYLAKAYGKETIPQDRLEIYTEFLSKELTVVELKKSFSKILQECKFFPSVAEIIELAKPKADINSEANIIANEIFECISRFGPQQTAEAKAYLGDKYFIAERFGWMNLCSIQNNEISTTKAQLRELAKAYLNKAKIAGVENLYELEKPNQQLVSNKKPELQLLKFELEKLGVKS